MHVHGTHLNLNLPVQPNAVAKSNAERRAAVLKKLMKAAHASDEEDSFKVSEGGNEEPDGQRDQRMDTCDPDGGAEPEEVRALVQDDEEPERTSMWA